MLNLSTENSQLQKAINGIVFVFTATILSINLAFHDMMFASVLVGGIAHFCLLYLVFYIKESFIFDKVFINNLPQFMNMIGLSFCLLSIVLFVLNIRPLAEITFVSAFLNILGFCFLTIKRNL